ncbi:MAG: CRTAC1 family protein, partial [Planctomycetota bacterium]|nr:CRTAC1 family protein [Planctomycetota bacterium]
PAAWPDGSYYLPEIMQGGVGLADLDGDDDLDLLQARVTPPGSRDGAVPRLWIQEDGGFRESTSSGIAHAGYGQGVAIGDADNDGDADVYFANYGSDRFYRNRGDGTFQDATDGAGFEGDRWSVGAAFCDVDGDGWLDLYVVHYVRYDDEAVCTDPAGRREYCGPQIFHGEQDRLYRNRGDGTFEDVTESAGLKMPQGGERARGLGVACVDLTGDGWADLYVANDAESNQLWVNRGDGSFTEQGVARGVAVNRHGKPEASMGVSVGDVDGDGSLDIFTTHLIQEHNTLFTGTAGPLFFDRSVESGLTVDDVELTGFGCAFFDADLDGDPDLAVTNGRVKRHTPATDRALSPFWREYAERNLLYRNDGGRFAPWGASAGEFARLEASDRGLAVGDLDGDGDLDLATSAVDDRVRIYENLGEPGDGGWLCVRPEDRGRAALGAIVELEQDGTRQRIPTVAADSYASSREPCAHFGLGERRGRATVRVTWADGRRERFVTDALDRSWHIRRGDGAPEAP